MDELSLCSRTAQSSSHGASSEPRDEAKGFMARVQFYMHDWYGLSISRQQQQIFSAWDRMYPVTDWERERDGESPASWGTPPIRHR